MDTAQIVSLIGNIGFPAVVAWYCLSSLNKTISANTEAISAMRETLAKLCEKLNVEAK